MATIPSNRFSNHSITFKNRRWIVFLPILILLVLSLTLCPVYLFYRLNVLETSLNRFKVNDVQYRRTIEDLRGVLSQELSNQNRDTPSEYQSELLALKTSVINSQMQIRQLTEVVEQYKRTCSQDVADQRIYVDRTISQLIVDIEAGGKDLINIGGTVQEDSAKIDTLQLDAQDPSDEVSTNQEQVTGLDIQTNHDDNVIIESDLHQKNSKETLKDLAGQKTQPNKPMSPFDSSDEDETLELGEKDEEAIVKLLKKASEKMQDGLKKGKKQMEKAMDKVKTATKKMGEKVGGVGDKLGGKISGQVQKLIENGRKVNEYIKSIIGATGSSGDFDNDLEL